MYKSFEDLDVWKESCALSLKVYTLFKDCKDYFLKDQINRASLSIASNIAEGAERDSNREFVRFLYIAKGSCAELRTQLYIAVELNIIDSKEGMDLINETKKISSKLEKLAQYFKNKKHNT